LGSEASLARVSSSPLDPYRAWLHDSVAPVVRGWGSDVSARRYEEACSEFVQRTMDDQASRKYAAACPVEGVDHTAYRLRELTLPGGGSLLSGIHFRGMSTSCPFVGVFAQTHWLSSRQMVEAHELLLHEFSPFRPRASWWWCPAHRSVPSDVESTPDQLSVMASLDELRAVAAPPLPPGWELRGVSRAGRVAAALFAMYRDFHLERPDLAVSVMPASAEELDACAQAGGLQVCFAQGDVVGLVAAKPGLFQGVEAWEVWDIALAKQFRGRGLSAALQRAALDRLDSSATRVVAGTIDARNEPSLRTALRVGRRIVGTSYFVSA